VPDLEPGQGIAVREAAVARAVVGQHALDPVPDLGEAGSRQLERPGGTLGSLVGDGHDNGVTAGVVDEHLEVVVATRSSILRCHTSPEHPPSAAIGQPAKLLVVLVDQRTVDAG
jgi:hypothetical protein